MKNITLSILYYISLGIALFIILFLYSDDYNFPWSKQDEGLKYLHFLTTLPIPLIISFATTFGIYDKEWKKIRMIRRVLVIITFCGSTIYMLADGGSLGSTKILVGFVIGLIITGIYLVFPLIEVLILKREKIKTS